MTEQPQSMLAAQPRARGEVRAEFDTGTHGARLAALRQAGSSRALFPRGPSTNLQMVLTNTSGGVTGGDRFRTGISVTGGAAVAVTTQAAERAYRAQPGETGRVDTKLGVGRSSRLHWLPQETILYKGCGFSRRLTLDIACDGQALLVEPVVFGRTAMGEVMAEGRFEDRVEIRRDNQTVFVDRTRLAGDIAMTLKRPGVADGAAAMAFIAFVSPGAAAALERVRKTMPETAGASLVRDDVLVARILAKDGFLLRKSLLPVIETLHGDKIPRPWMI